MIKPSKRLWASLLNALQIPLSIVGAFYIATHEYIIGITLVVIAVLSKFIYSYVKPYWD